MQPRKLIELVTPPDSDGSGAAAAFMRVSG
jgi:hypothetical protein